MEFYSIHPATSALCEILDVDPLRLIDPARCLLPSIRRVMRSLSDADIPSAHIGAFTESGYQLFDHHDPQFRFCHREGPRLQALIVFFTFRPRSV